MCSTTCIAGGRDDALRRRKDAATGPEAARSRSRRARPMLTGAHALLQPFAVLLELLGAGIIVGAVGLATLVFLIRGVRDRDWRAAYTNYRANLGRGILLGLELLVGADIISTITAPLTLETVGLLGLVVLIRTFLSFSLETEIEGCWPWRRAERHEARKPDQR